MLFSGSRVMWEPLTGTLYMPGSGGARIVETLVCGEPERSRINPVLFFRPERIPGRKARTTSTGKEKIMQDTIGIDVSKDGVGRVSPERPMPRAVRE